jgi:hypothetical protein
MKKFRSTSAVALAGAFFAAALAAFLDLAFMDESAASFFVADKRLR